MDKLKVLEVLNRISLELANLRGDLMSPVQDTVITSSLPARGTGSLANTPGKFPTALGMADECMKCRCSGVPHVLPCILPASIRRRSPTAEVDKLDATIRKDARESMKADLEHSGLHDLIIGVVESASFKRMVQTYNRERKPTATSSIPIPGRDAPVHVPAHRAQGMRCRTCMFYVLKQSIMSTSSAKGEEVIGRCRRRAPTLNGWPLAWPYDWCGDHKLLEAGADAIDDRAGAGESPA